MAANRANLGFYLILVVTCSACATLPQGALVEAGRKAQDEARRLEREGRLYDSLERWKVTLAIDPQDAEAKQRQRELEKAIAEKVRQHVVSGKERLQRRDGQAAQREFLAALRLDPTNREALGQLYESDQEFGVHTAFARPLRKGGIQAKTEPSQGGEGKAPAGEEAEEDEESGEEVSLAEATELFRKGDYLGAIEAFNRVLAQQPGLREAVEFQKLAYYNQGLAYMKGENYTEALKMFERVRRIQPDFKRVSHEMQTTREKLADQHNQAGIRHFREKKLKEAIEEWDQALVLNPRLETAKRSQDQARRLLKRLEEIK